MKRIAAFLLALILMASSVVGATAESDLLGNPVAAASVVSWILSEAGKAAGRKAINWGLDSLYDITFGEDKPDADTAAQLEKLLSSNAAISNQVAKLSDTVVNASLLSEINGFIKWTWTENGYKAFRALKRIDEQLEEDKAAANAIEDTEKKKKALEDAIDDAAQSRKNELLYVIPKRQEGLKPTGYITDFDEQAITYAKYLLTEMGMANGKSGTLFDMYYESVRLSGQYKWENQAYTDILDFETNALAGFVVAATVDRLSLCARIEEIEAWNKANPKDKASAYTLKEQLDELDKYIKMVSNIKVIQERTNERYYWVSGHEMIFSLAKQATIPQENTNKGIFSIQRNQPTSDSVQGLIKVRNSQNEWVIRVNTSFWRKFTYYNGKNKQNVSYDQLKTVYNDYGGKKTLYDIFFVDAAMPTISGADSSWSFVIHPEEKYPLSYARQSFKADRLQAFVVTNKTASSSLDKPHRTTLAFYHYKKTDMTTDNNFIAISAKDVSGRDYLEDNEDYSITEEEEAPIIEWNGGDLTVSFGDPSQVLAYTVQLDLETVSPKNLSMTEDIEACTITIAQNALAGYPVGQHQLTATFQCADGESIQCSYDFIITSALPETGDAFPMALMACLCAASLLGLGWLWLNRRRA